MSLHPDHDFDDLTVGLAGVCRCSTTSFPSSKGTIVVLRIAGELDGLTLPFVVAAVTAELDRGPAHLVVDLGGLSFCGVRGLAELAAAGRAAAGHGIGYAVSGCSAHLTRVWTMVWGDEAPLRYRNAAAAVTAIRANQVSGSG